MAKLAAIALVGTIAIGCGDNVELDAAVCTTTFAGNFAEVARSSASCAAIGPNNTIAFDVPATMLSMPLVVAIELDGLTAGTYSSETVPAWSANAARAVDASSCLYVGGSTSTPQGDFTLTIAAIDTAPHGSLVLDLAVLQQLAADCGANLDETIEVTF